MDRQRKKALTLMLVGVILPLLLIPFLTNYKPEAGWWWNLMNIKVAFGTAIAVPYRFILAFCIFLIFVGVRQLDLLKR
jgi:hypothetical protein